MEYDEDQDETFQVVTELPDDDVALEPGASVPDEDILDGITDEILAQVKFAQRSRKST
jgi:hypothetical protein